MILSFEAQPFLEQRAELGEGPVWDVDSDALWWIDWARGDVFKADIAAETCVGFHVGSSVSAAALCTTGRVALALDHGFSVLDPESGRVRQLRAVESDERKTRMNDGKCDAAGRFWAGTMSLDERSATGVLLVLEGDGSVRRVLEGIVCSNGLCWSEDNTRFFYIDSATGRIDGFDFDLPEGAITNRLPVVVIPPEEGIPDGLTIDARGYLWVALWDGWQVRRYSPAGELDAVIELPVANPTCCTLGGDDLRDLFITTAMPLEPEKGVVQPLAGRLFRARVDTPGLPAHKCRCELM